MRVTSAADNAWKMTRALELGIDTFDTADSYSLGNSERRLGEILKENRSNLNIKCQIVSLNR